MKAVTYHGYGSPDVLRLEDIPKPTATDDQILIKVHATTVGTWDCECRSFTFPLWFWLPLRLVMGVRKPRWPVLGQELAGEIEAVGKNVKRFKKGDQVFASTGLGFGAHAEYACLPSSGAIAIKPANMGYDEAAGIPTGGDNALHFLRKVDIRNGQRVLVNGAGGNIGVVAVQLAKHFGAEVTAVDSADNLDTIRDRRRPRHRLYEGRLHRRRRDLRRVGLFLARAVQSLTGRAVPRTVRQSGAARTRGSPQKQLHWNERRCRCASRQARRPDHRPR